MAAKKKKAKSKTKAKAKAKAKKPTRKLYTERQQAIIREKAAYEAELKRIAAEKLAKANHALYEVRLGLLDGHLRTENTIMVRVVAVCVEHAISKLVVPEDRYIAEVVLIGRELNKRDYCIP